MSRINKIVSKHKSETGVDGLLHNRETISNKSSAIEYTQTKKIPVSEESLMENRVISRSKLDPRATKFQILRTKVLQQMRKRDWNSLAITAPTPGAGKSLVAANLACSIAMEGNQSVLLVDMDLRKPSIHKYFGFKPEWGIHDILDESASVEDVLINPGVDNLVVMPGRKGVLNSSEQISTPLVKNLVEELKSRYKSRLVIFDLPPVLVSDDVMVFLPYVDCSLLVVESGGNTPKEVEATLDTFGTNPLLGTILNKVQNISKNFIY